MIGYTDYGEGYLNPDLHDPRLNHNREIDDYGIEVELEMEEALCNI
ncbi:hypothetical protein [uncultured Methanobrevibacter sp.]|nr:hypothetical protein [uncultured Methanobrevibacter sp.]